MCLTQQIKSLFLYVFLAAGAAACGIPLGGVIVANDPAPTGNVVVVYSGQLLTQNAAAHPTVSVSGTAKVYRDFDSGIHWVRIENLVGPNESGLVVIVEAGGTVLNAGLRGTRGHMTYSTTVPSTDTRIWSSVKIRSTTWPDPITRDYGEALLQ